jgi:hypothetical protein
MAGSSGDTIGKDIAEIKKLRQLKRDTNEQLNASKPQLNELEDERKILEKKVHKNYRTSEEVEAGLK